MNPPRAISKAAAIAGIAALFFSTAGYATRPGPVPGAEVEQRAQGDAGAVTLVESFDGLGAGFQGPQGTARFMNPSDDSLAVGPDHIVQIVNSRIAIFTKKGRRFRRTGDVLYGPMPTNTVFRGFGGAGEANNNGDAVVRYDQLANRWVVVMPVFRPAPYREGQPQPGVSGGPATLSVPGVAGQPGPAMPLYVPPPGEQPAPVQHRPPRGPRPSGPKGVYSLCYAVSATPDPLGPWYRYEFLRPLFPDYPRLGIWPDGYYVGTSTGDTVIQKHVCVAERDKMLRDEPASEQCMVIDGVNFLNPADLDGKALPPRGAPNIILAAGGTQLKGVFEDDGIFAWQLHVDWRDATKTKLTGPVKVPVAPYHYLCDGQLTNCVPQPGTTRRLDAQGDKIMSRVVYRRVGKDERLVAVHSVNTAAGGGGVRWYELGVGKGRALRLVQQGTYAPDGFYRWMASPAMDRDGNIGIGYSFGGTPNFAGQRFAGRLAGDPPGRLTLREAVLAEGEASQNAMRWEDYTQTALDPTDDRTIWYVGDYLKKDSTAYSTRIGAFRLEHGGE